MERDECSAGKDCDCMFRKPAKNRVKPEPVKKKPGRLATPNTERYLKLHNGNVYDVDSNTVLWRQALKALLDG